MQQTYGRRKERSRRNSSHSKDLQWSRASFIALRIQPQQYAFQTLDLGDTLHGANGLSIKEFSAKRVNKFDNGCNTYAFCHVCLVSDRFLLWCMQQGNVFTQPSHGGCTSLLIILHLDQGTDAFRSIQGGKPHFGSQSLS